MMNVSNMPSSTDVSIFEKAKNQQCSTFTKFDEQFDEFVNKNKKLNEDDDFSFKEAIKNFGKGLISPILALKNHPFISAGMIMGISVACMLIPAITPVLTVGFGVASVWQIGKSTYDTIKNYSQGKYNEAEKGFEQIGTGVIGAALTFLGLKSSAKIAAETKLAYKNGSIGITTTQKANIAETISKGSYYNALKENASMLITKDGFNSIISQLKPSAIKERVLGFFNLAKYIGKTPDEQLNMQIAKFKKTPEGIRRAALSEEQLKTEITAKVNNAFDELNIPLEQRPKIIIQDTKSALNNIQRGGGYTQQNHKLVINPETYKAGLMELDNILMHEATHCKEALLRASLPKQEAQRIVNDILSQRILNGESEQILMRGTNFGPQMMKAPNMPQAMRKEFVQFAKDNLYLENDALRENFTVYLENKSILNSPASAQFPNAASTMEKAKQTIVPFVEQIETIAKKYPEFIKQYKSPEEAVAILEQYALSHKVRYDIFTDTTINGVTPPTITPDKISAAENSLRGYIETVEGNLRLETPLSNLENIFNGNKGYNQYQFSAEEVLAQQNGNKYLIRNYKDQLAQMKQSGTLTPEREAFLNAEIQKAEATIAYKTKGAQYYDLYTKSLNNPNDAELAARAKSLKLELEMLEMKLMKDDASKIGLVLSKSVTPPWNMYYGITIPDDKNQ